MKKLLCKSIALRRTVRIGIPASAAGMQRKISPKEPHRNGFAGIPPSDGFTAHHEVTVECVGVPDARTGYLIGIQEIDALVRAHLAPLLESFFRSSQPIHPADAVT